MSVIENFLSNAATYIVGFVLVVLVVQKGIGLWDWFASRFGIETKGSKDVRTAKAEHAAFKAKVEDLYAQMELQAQELQTVKDENENIKNMINEVSEKVSVLGRMIAEAEEKKDASERYKIRNTIAQMYRYYAAEDKQCWTKMERDAFNGLIRSYELAGGKNSFVHDVCEPESMTWKVIDEE